MRVFEDRRGRQTGPHSLALRAVLVAKSSTDQIDHCFLTQGNSLLSGSFVHLHCHSHYSLLDGASSIGKLINRAKDHGMNALALTDHGNLHGALEFYKKAKAADINPIIGYEAYVAPGSRFSRGDATSSKDASYHLTLLAKNRQGFKNLIKLASQASLEGFYFKPRIDRELLAELNEGIICLSGCVSSEFSRAVLRNEDTDKVEEEAIKIAQWFHGVFGDRYYIEVMNNNLEIQRRQLEGAVRIANKVGLPVVATSDAHYADRSDAEIQDVLLCINTGKFRTDTARMKMEGDQFYLRSPQEMYASFVGLEDAVARSQEIANTVEIDLELGKRHFPVYPLPPEEKDPDQYLRDVCVLGLKDRYQGNEEMLPGGELSEVAQARLDRELGVIQRLGFANYFLIVWDFVRHSREQGVPNTARGSGVGALVCYATYLSHVCPIKYDLLFERFLDENRLEAPDIDIDFCKDRRAEIIQYVRDKYGEENVAQIGTFGTMAAKAAIKDVGRALGIPLMRVNQITEMVPDELKITIKKALDKNIELQATYDGDSEVRELLDIAMKLEGNARNVGTHAAAVVIADKPLTEYVPLGRVSGKTDIITQWSMGDVEEAGLLKMDFLGLRNLTILSKAVQIIQQTTGQELDLLRIPLDDKPTFALLQRGETKGVFQLESGGIRDLLQRMKPDHFSDIIATNALYRPGPLEGGMVDDYVAVKHKRKEAIYLHEVLKDILEETNGVMVYQEQVMRILNRLGGIELAAAYTCIKAISKKKESLIAQNESKFIEGATEKGLTEKQAREMWEMILKFAGYGFNKCVVGETPIMHAQTGERTTVGELFRDRREWTIHALGDDWKLRPRRVTDVVWNGRKRVYRVRTQRGAEIVATANHPLRTIDGWTLIENLNVGDRIAATRELRCSEEIDWPHNESNSNFVERVTTHTIDRESEFSIDEGWQVSAEGIATLVQEQVDVARSANDSEESDVYWDTIVSIEPAGIQDTYDLTVEEDHNFVAGSIIAHNSHSTAYALLAYQTAYLKAHYPVEFMAALLSGDIPGRNFKRKDSLIEHIEDCERMEIEVVNPDVNSSDVDFAVEEKKIFFALSAIKGCGGGAAEAISAERRKNGPFLNIFDFCERVETSGCNRAAIETLIKAGAFDSTGAKRAQLMAVVEKAIQSGSAMHADRRSGQMNLFGEETAEPETQTALNNLPEIDEFPEKAKLMMEKEVLGMYLTAHPLEEYQALLASFCSHQTTNLKDVKDRQEVIVGGMISSIKLANTKNPKPGAPSKYANFDLEDVQGAVRCICWPDGYEKVGHMIQSEAVVIMRATVDKRGGSDDVNLLANEIIPIAEAETRFMAGLKINVDQDRHAEEMLAGLHEVLRGYPGNMEVLVALRLTSGDTVQLKSKRHKVSITPELRGRLDDLLGTDSHRLMISPPKPKQNTGGRRSRE